MVVRTTIHLGGEAFGVRRGFAGLIAGDLHPLGRRDVGGIIQLGGTVLGSARCPEFKSDAGSQQALASLRSHRIDGVVVIGGNGSQTGAHALARLGVPTVGVASTIDNDLVGSDITIGVDTALNVALEAIDRLRVTASSHHRASIVEVMGRDCGYLALMAGIAGGAEAILIPEAPTAPEAVEQMLRAAHARGKSSALVVVAEGATPEADTLGHWFRDRQKELGYDVRVTTLGHVQRGGTPTAFDRLLATRLGAAAAERLDAGETGIVVGLVAGALHTTPLADVVGRTKQPDPQLLRLANIVSE
jgi:6-phosphofructokinase 1